jgi:hypothetical protein
MSKLTNAQLRQIEEREMIKKGVSPAFLACPELDVRQYHDKAIQSFLKSPTYKGKPAKGKSYPEVVLKDLYPNHHSMMTIICVGGKIFLFHTEGTCITHELQDKNPKFADDDIEVVPPRTIIIDISGDLSGQEIVASVQAHELVHAVLPRSVYHIEVCISSGNQSQTIRVLINLNQQGEDELYIDGSVRKNLVIWSNKLEPCLLKSDGNVFLAEVLNDDTTEELECSLTEVVGSIRFDPVLQSTKMQEVD